MAWLWCAGLCFGYFVAYGANLTYASWMRPLLSQQVSIVGLLGSAVLPFLVSDLCFAFGGQQLLCAVSFFRAARFAFVSAGVISCCGSAGWLFFLLLLGCDLLELPLLWWFWIRSFYNTDRVRRIRDLLICISSVTVLCLLQRYWIIPFLSEITNFVKG